MSTKTKKPEPAPENNVDENGCYKEPPPGGFDPPPQERKPKKGGCCS